MNFVFKSTSHIRFENGRVASPRQVGVNRAIKVDCVGDIFTVTIYNLDGNHPVWQNNVQMAPKRMKIVRRDLNKIVLRGFGQDATGSSFADYGLTIEIEKEEVKKCILHLYDRNIDIEYFNDNVSNYEEPQILSLSKRANSQFQNEEVTDGGHLLIDIFNSIRANPGQLRNLSDYSPLGTSFVLMLDQKLSDDIDVLQAIASVGYLCISKSIENNINDLNLYKNRLLLLQLGHEPLVQTVMAAFQLNAGSIFNPLGDSALLEARDALFKMEIADLEQHPQLYLKVPFFKERKNEFDDMIERDFFLPERTIRDIVKSGNDNHRKLLEYLENKVLFEGTVDF